MELIFILLRIIDVYIGEREDYVGAALGNWEKSDRRGRRNLGPPKLVKVR